MEYSNRIKFTMLAGLTLISVARMPAQSPPAACTNCSGTRTDNYGYTWILDTTGGQPGTVSGSFTSNGVDGCPNTTRSVSGTHDRTNGQFNINATNPNPPAGTPCANGAVIADFINYPGTIDSGGCNTGSGSWSNGQPPGGSFSWSKPCDVPSGDTTYYSNFWGDSNQDVNTSEPTVYLWYGQVNADRDFTGRTVMEQQGPPGNDACWFEGSLALKFDHVTGGSWNVNTPALFYNGYAFDEVGWISQAVNY
jgi:hypothetical protein